MKIISKYRDYYDHLVGYYGFDETRVYDRRNDVKNIPYNYPGKYPQSKGLYLIAICGKLYPSVEFSGKLYCHPDQMPNNLWKEGFEFLKDRTHKHCVKTTIANIQKRQPVILMDINWSGDKPTDFIPTLSTYGIPSVLSANECYEQIYNFLGWLKDNPEPCNNQTDKDKIIAHGFDLKDSFRPRIKVKKLK